MPKTIERKIRARGGVIRYRTLRSGGKLFRIAVVRAKGPRGGRTIGYETPD